MQRVFLPAAIALLATGAATAADPIVVLDPIMVEPTPVYDWSGFFAGVHGGWGFGSIGNEFDVAPPGPAFTPQPAFAANGFVGGVQAGVLQQMDTFVLGAEARLDWVGISGNDAGLSGATDAFTGRFSGQALVSAGLALDMVSPYVIGGVTVLNYDYSLTIAPDTATVNSTTFGGSVGAGVRVALTDDISIFGEYIHTFYPTQTLAFPATGGIAAQSINVTPSIGQATVGVNFRF
jgi:outer membrane immunogenic protein